MNTEFVPLIGISIGDMNGIGPEVVIKALSNNRINKICTPIIYGSGKHLSKYKSLLNFNDWQFSTINQAKFANNKQINLINCFQGDYFELNLGQAEKNAGNLAYLSLEKAVSDLKNGFIDALVTAPINKDNIQNDQFIFPGHTEYLAAKFDKKEVLMFLVSEELKVGVVTGHLPLEDVKKNISKPLIKNTLDLMIQSLKNDFGIQKPRIAVLGLNPHAGENGLLGKEEKEIIAPVIDEFRNKRQLVFGPFPTDGFFGNQEYKKYDAVLAMYHDQGLTPFKMLAFDNGVNFTAGLPAVRTSPDHGTAFGIAGKNIADENSMLNAIYAAVDIARRRKSNAELAAGALKPLKMEDLHISREKN